MIKKLLPVLLFSFSLEISFAQNTSPCNGKSDVSEIERTYWDKDKKQIRSEGRYNCAGFSGIGREEGKWKYWYSNGQLEAIAEFKKGLLHGHVVKYYENGSKMHEGWFIGDLQDSLSSSWFNNGKLRETGYYDQGKKTGEWKYYNSEGNPILIEKYKDGQEYIMAYWDKNGKQLIRDGNGTMYLYNTSDEVKEEYHYKNGLKDGPFYEKNALGMVTTSGEYSGGKKSGKWVFKSAYGKIRKESNYLNDLPHGRYLEYYDNDSLMIRGEHKEGKKHGLWEWFFDNGTTDMRGNFENDLQSGEWYFGYNNGNKNYGGKFETGLREGEWLYYYPEGQLFMKGHFSNDQKNGEWITYFEKGNELSKGSFKDGLEHGKWQSWYENGTAKDEGNFDSGLMSGEWKGWYPNGNINYQGSYLRGHKNGKWTYWFSNGKPREEGNFKVVPGKDSEILPDANSSKDEISIRHGKWVAYSERGEKTAEGSYLEGEMHGKWQFWQPGGIMLAQEQNYKNGVLHGVSVSYDKAGRKISEAHYKDGMFHGDYKIWNDKGMLVQHLVYKDGRKVKDVLNKKNF